MAVWPSISRVILYVKEIERVAAFYQMFFGMKRTVSEEPGWIELEPDLPGSSWSVAPLPCPAGQLQGRADCSRVANSARFGTSSIHV
jgi:hypothetical protein